MFSRLASAKSFSIQVNENGDPICFISFVEPQTTAAFLQNSMNDRILSIDQSRGIQLFSLLSSNNKYVLQPEISGEDQIKLSVPFAHDIIMNPKLFATSKDGKYLFTCGHWDNSFKLSSIDSMKVIRSIIAHDGMFYKNQFNGAHSFFFFF